MTTYTYSVEGDFPNNKVTSDRLTREIQASSITVALGHINTSSESCEIIFKADLAAAEKLVLDGLIAAHSGEKLPDPAMTSDNIPFVAPVLAEGRRYNVFTPNWCDKTTWYYDSEKVTDEILTTANQAGYAPAIARPWVDVTHGKIFGEISLRETYKPTIKVDDIVMQELNPDTHSGDYSIDYTNGNVIFETNQAEGAVVTATYYFPKSSLFVIKPESGKKLRIAEVEVQTTTDIVMTDTLLFQLFASNGQGGLVPVSDQEAYQTMQDFINDSNIAYPLIPKIGGDSWRGMKEQEIVFKFDYKATTDLLSSYGMEIHVWLENDRAFGGGQAIGTFYAVTLDE
jgi:hypothetical protein